MSVRGWLEGFIAGRPTTRDRAKFPERLLILNHWWTVEPVEFADDQLGECKTKQLRVLIDADIWGTALGWSVLWHEAGGHALWWEMGVNSEAGDDLEENVVNALCQGQVRLLRDNPALVRGLGTVR